MGRQLGDQEELVRGHGAGSAPGTENSKQRPEGRRERSPFHRLKELLLVLFVVVYTTQEQSQLTSLVLTFTSSQGSPRL